MMEIGMDKREIKAASRRADYRRIGRKVLASGRLAAAMERTPSPKRRGRSFAFPKVRFTKRLALVLGSIVVLAGAGAGAVAMWQHQSALAAAKAQQAQFAQEKKDKAQEMACRQQKLAAKQDLYGKVTYDELYDGAECASKAQ